jgi:CDP-diacylglycerol--serine O-phosphatidyltransferase
LWPRSDDPSAPGSADYEGRRRRDARPRAVLHRVRTQTRRRFSRGVYLLPSVLTMANMFCGYACVVYAMRGEYRTAAPFIGVALVLDMLDGRIARLTGTSTAFGLEFDSLADVISFGMAPAVLAFAWGLHPLGRLGWAASFLFVAAAAMRLARFNIQAPAADKRFFVGMPSPSAAAVPAATIFAFPDGLPGGPALVSAVALAVVLVPAFLMVSTLRFHSFKTIDLRSRRSYRHLIVIALLLVAVASHPEVVLLLMAYAYLASAPAGYAVARLRRRRDDGATLES